LPTEALDAEVALVKTDEEFTQKLGDLIERDKEILDRLAE
jgi:hypothetical protein